MSLLNYSLTFRWTDILNYSVVIFILGGFIINVVVVVNCSISYFFFFVFNFSLHSQHSLILPFFSFLRSASKFLFKNKNASDGKNEEKKVDHLCLLKLFLLVFFLLNIIILILMWIFWILSMMLLYCCCYKGIGYEEELILKTDV